MQTWNLIFFCFVLANREREREREREKKKKGKKKIIIKDEKKFLMGKTTQIEWDGRTCKFENVVLKNNLRKFSGKQVCSGDMSLTCSSGKIMHLKQGSN